MQMFEHRLPLPVRDAVRQCRSHVVAALLFSALVNILYLAPTLYMMQVYDRVVPTGGVVTLVILTLVLGAAIATIGVLEALRSRLSAVTPGSATRRPHRRCASSTRCGR
jgi:ABC-type protease/lipase transport system fused ATPase/permease subunit